MNAVHFKPTPDRLEQMAEHEANKEKDEANLKKNCREDVQLPAKFTNHRAAFLELFGKFKSM